MSNEKRPNRNLAQEAVEPKRPKRKTFDNVGPLSFEGCPPDKVLRVVNDVRNRVAQKLAQGWQFVAADSIVAASEPLTVATEKGTAYAQIVDYDSRSNQPIYGYLMCIDRDLYDEYQAAIQAEVDANFEAMNDTLKSSVPGGYVPKSR